MRRSLLNYKSSCLLGLDAGASDREVISQKGRNTLKEDHRKLITDRFEPR
jgi:hypothetical protein